MCPLFLHPLLLARAEARENFRRFRDLSTRGKIIAPLYARVNETSFNRPPPSLRIPLNIRMQALKFSLSLALTTIPNPPPPPVFFQATELQRVHPFYPFILFGFIQFRDAHSQLNEPSAARYRTTVENRRPPLHQAAPAPQGERERSALQTRKLKCHIHYIYCVLPLITRREFIFYWYY